MDQKEFQNMINKAPGLPEKSNAAFIYRNVWNSYMVKKSEYNFFVFSCPAIIPFNIALHTWIVIVYPGWKMTRWELGHFKNKKTPSLWYIHKDYLAPRKWIEKYFWKTNKHFESSLLYHCSGNSKSLAYKMISRVEKHIEKYPLKHEYRLVWHNSNYFTQRVLKHFPEMRFKLPWNAIWK